MTCFIIQERSQFLFMAIALPRGALVLLACGMVAIGGECGPHAYYRPPSASSWREPGEQRRTLNRAGKLSQLILLLTLYGETSISREV
jgi:hypothetical protein